MARALRSSIAMIVLAAALLAGTGCRSSQVPAAVPSAETTVTVEASAGVEATAAPEPLAESQAKSLEAELEAIEKELDALDLPSDSDFEGIEGALP